MLAIRTFTNINAYSTCRIQQYDTCMLKKGSMTAVSELYLQII